MEEHLQQLQAQAEKWSPEEVLRWAYATFQSDIAMASGLGAEGMVLMDIASRVRSKYMGLRCGAAIPMAAAI